MTTQFDVAVIGAGPGGYVAAVHASQLGLKVAVIEKDKPGGVCLNWGCIPSKNLIHQAEAFHSMIEMEAVGVTVDRSGLDYKKVQANSRAVVKTLTGGVAGLLKRNKVETISGTAKITGRGEIVVSSEGQSEIKVSTKNILVATGSRPMSIRGFEFDEKVVLSSTGILDMKKLPKSIVILGAGAIGCEFAYVMNSFGVNVTLVEMAEHILPSEDFETCAVLEKCFIRDGIEILTSTRAKSLQKTATSATVTVENGDGDKELKADKVLVVFGRAPNTAGLGLESMGVKLDDQGYVEVGDYCETHSAGIYAIGDITRTPALAHVASAEGELAIQHMAGKPPGQKAIDTDLVPSAIYCEPQVAGFGLREDQAKTNGVAIKKSVFPYQGAGKTIAVGKPDGLVKVLCNPKNDEVLGAHIVGHNATELLHELLLVKTAELLPEDVSNTMHAHPTISEAIMECMRGVNGKAIHG